MAARKWFLSLFLGLMTLPVMAQDTTMVQPWTCPVGFDGQSLHVYNWTTYVAEDTISNFERLCGVQVTYDTYDGLETLVTALQDAGVLEATTRTWPRVENECAGATGGQP